MNMEEKLSAASSHLERKIKIKKFPVGVGKCHDIHFTLHSLKSVKCLTQVGILPRKELSLTKMDL